MDECVGSSVARVLGEEEPDASSGHRYEPRKAGLELVLPLLCKTQASVPSNGASSVLDPKDGNDLFFHNVRILFKRDDCVRGVGSAASGCQQILYLGSPTLTISSAGRAGAQRALWSELAVSDDGSSEGRRLRLSRDDEI
jgi:hypothetical protein